METHKKRGLCGEDEYIRNGRNESQDTGIGGREDMCNAMQQVAVDVSTYSASVERSNLDWLALGLAGCKVQPTTRPSIRWCERRLCCDKNLDIFTVTRPGK